MHVDSIRVDFDDAEPSKLLIHAEESSNDEPGSNSRLRERIKTPFISSIQLDMLPVELLSPPSLSSPASPRELPDVATSSAAARLSLKMHSKDASPRPEDPVGVFSKDIHILDFRDFESELASNLTSLMNSPTRGEQLNIRRINQEEPQQSVVKFVNNLVNCTVWSDIFLDDSRNLRTCRGRLGTPHIPDGILRDLRRDFDRLNSRDADVSVLSDRGSDQSSLESSSSGRKIRSVGWSREADQVVLGDAVQADTLRDCRQRFSTPFVGEIYVHGLAEVRLREIKEAYKRKTLILYLCLSHIFTFLIVVCLCLLRLFLCFSSLFVSACCASSCVSHRCLSLLAVPLLVFLIVVCLCLLCLFLCFSSSGCYMFRRIKHL